METEKLYTEILQRNLNEAGIGDASGNALKVDGVYGTKTMLGHKTALDEMGMADNALLFGNVDMDNAVKFSGTPASADKEINDIVTGGAVGIAGGDYYPGVGIDINGIKNEELKTIAEQTKNISVYNEKKWTNGDIYLWLDYKGRTGSDAVINEFKDGWISSYRDVIIEAAKVYDIPPELLAGVAWIEVGGDPIWIDDAVYLYRENVPKDLGGRLLKSKDPNKTSFGYVSMQVNVAAETLGIDPQNMNRETTVEIINALKNPKFNIFIAAKHLASLKKIDFGDKDTKALTKEDIISIANRYNMGATASKDRVDSHYYGQRFMERIDIINRLLFP